MPVLARSLKGHLRAEGPDPVADRVVPQRFYLAAKRFRTSESLALKFKLHATCDAVRIDGAAKYIWFKAPSVEPLPHASHEGRQLLAPAPYLNHIQHNACATPAE